MSGARDGPNLPPTLHRPFSATTVSPPLWDRAGEVGPGQGEGGADVFSAQEGFGEMRGRQRGNLGHTEGGRGRGQGPSLCPTNVPPQMKSPSCSLPLGHPKGTEPHGAMSPPAHGDSPAQDRALGDTVLTQYRVMAQGHRLDPSSRSPEPWARQRGMSWGPPGWEERSGQDTYSAVLPSQNNSSCLQRKGQRQ